MSSITAQLRQMGLSSTTYQEKQTLSLEQAIQELDLLSTTVSTENYTEEGLLDTIWNGIKAFFKAIGDFFARLFGKGPAKEQEKALAETEKQLDDLADAVKTIEVERAEPTTERLVEDTLDDVYHLPFSNVKFNNKNDVEAWMMSDADKPNMDHVRDNTLDDAEKIKKTRAYLSSLTGDNPPPARSAEEKSAFKLQRKVAQVLPASASTAEVNTVANRTLAVTEAKMKLVLQEHGKCNLPGIDYEGSKLHIAIANFKILRQTITNGSDLHRVTGEISGYIKNKKYTELTERLKYGPLGNGFDGRVEWDKAAGEVVFRHNKKTITFENHIDDVLSSGVLAANSYEKLISDRSFKNIGEMIKSVSESVDLVRRSLGVGSKVETAISEAVSVVEKMDSATDAAAKEAIKAAGGALRTMGKIAAVKEQSERTALANALQAVRILRRKAGQLKEYNGLLNKLNEEVAKVKSRK